MEDMRILIINPPHPAIGSRIPKEQLTPLGLLSIGGSLIDVGHDVTLVDAEFGPMTDPQILNEVSRIAPDAVLFGHSGSTSRLRSWLDCRAASGSSILTSGLSMAGYFPPIIGETSSVMSRKSMSSFGGRGKKRFDR
jgi:hypothetical protein